MMHLSELTPSTAELKSAYKQTNLWRGGISFEQAIKSPATLIGLKAIVRCAMEKQPNQPQQAVLI